MIKGEDQDPSNFCCGCFHSQPRLFGKAEGQGQGSLLVQQSLQGQSASISHMAIAGARGTAVLTPAIEVAGISWGRKGKDKNKE